MIDVQKGVDFTVVRFNLIQQMRVTSTADNLPDAIAESNCEAER